MSERRRAAVSPKTSRRHRARPTPKWLLKKQELDEIAQRRTLMILSVLSGEKPVTDAISEAQISRGHYYELEERALKAILEAMEPGASAGRPPETTTRLLQLEEQVKQLEAGKRRLERLLQLTRKVLRPGPLKTSRGGPGRPRRKSESDGRSASPGSTLAKTTGHVSGSPIASSVESTR
jgi:hypothetical protein